MIERQKTRPSEQRRTESDRDEAALATERVGESESLDELEKSIQRKVTKLDIRTEVNH
jgi:hypothetical protein